MAAPWFRRITFHSVLASVCPLIPIPLLDDWAVDWIRRRQIADLLRSRGFEPLDWHLDVLSGAEDVGWLRGCLTFTLTLPFKILVWLIKKIFRTLLVVLLLKDCVDRFSETFHQGFLLALALDRGWIDAAALAGGHRLHQVHYAIAGTCEAIDPRPIHQLVRRIYRGSRQVLVEAARLLAPVLRAERKRQRAERKGSAAPTASASTSHLEGESGAVAGVLDRLTAALWHEEGYRAQLEETLERYFVHATASDSPPTPEPPTAPGPPAISAGEENDLTGPAF